MGKKLEGRAALVTGSSRGMGRAIALRFGEEGADVVVNYNHHSEQAQEVVDAIVGAGSRAIAVQADVSQPDQVERMVARVLDAFGRVDVLVNNAGIGGTSSLLKDMPLEMWHQSMSVNLTGVFLTTRLLVGGMMERRDGRIINIASVAGQFWRGASGSSHYCAAKGGVIAFTKALAIELAPYNVLVNCISPGTILTELSAHRSEEWRRWRNSFVPLGRAGEVGEIAATALFLATDATFFTGQVLGPNGGEAMVG